jgi:hypothetical protein
MTGHAFDMNFSSYRDSFLAEALEWMTAYPGFALLDGVSLII